MPPCCQNRCLWFILFTRYCGVVHWALLTFVLFSYLSILETLSCNVWLRCCLPLCSSPSYTTLQGLDPLHMAVEWTGQFPNINFIKKKKIWFTCSKSSFISADANRSLKEFRLEKQCQWMFVVIYQRLQSQVELIILQGFHQNTLSSHKTHTSWTRGRD